MAKKLSLLLAAVAVLAFAVPAMASAAPALVGSSIGKLVATGTTVTGTGKRIALTSTLIGEIKCEVLNAKGVLVANNSTEGIDISGAKEKPTQETCTNPNGAVTVTSLTLNTLKSTVGGTATVNFEAIIDVGTLVCTFKGTNVTGTYALTGSVVTFTNATGITSSPAGCGTIKLDGAFTLETPTEKVEFIF